MCRMFFNKLGPLSQQQIPNRRMRSWARIQTKRAASVARIGANNVDHGTFGLGSMTVSLSCASNVVLSLIGPEI